MWLHKILHLNPAKWPIGRSIRTAIGVGTPLTIGYLSGNMLICLWITLGVMMQSVSEGPGSYRALFRLTMIGAPIGALGYLAGYLWKLPDPVAILILAGVAFLAGIVNSYGAAYSKGTLQALLGAALAYGLAPEIHSAIHFWEVSLLYLAGVLYYLLLLSMEAVLDKKRPERELLVNYLTTLANFASARSNVDNDHSNHLQIEVSKRAALDKYEELYAILLEHRSANSVRSKENTNNAIILQAGDSVFAAILAETDKSRLSTTANELQQLANAIEHDQPLPKDARPGVATSRLTARLNELFKSVETFDSITVPVSDKVSLAFKASELWKNRSLDLQHLMVGPEVIKAGAKLSLCMSIAFSMKYVVHGNHWYWIPLTVSLVMKPELGSVFVRAVLRILGTALGVIIATVMLMFIPKGIALLLILMALASSLPWAGQRSYALLTFFLTPLVLILIDLTTPGLRNIDYGGQRLIDTAIGGVIVLIFGYFIWPRTHQRQLVSTYQAVMNSLANYFHSICIPPDTTMAQGSRHDVYSQLSNLRTQLQKQLSEPPPVNREASSWFPIVVAAEQLADRMTVYEENRQDEERLPDPQIVNQIAQHMHTIVERRETLNVSSHYDAQNKETIFLDEVTSDLNVISRLLQQQQGIDQ